MHVNHKTTMEHDCITNLSIVVHGESMRIEKTSGVSEEDQHWEYNCNDDGGQRRNRV